MEPSDFEAGNFYKVLFEKQIPIEFKYLKTTPDGKVVCRKSDGEIFNFNSLPQYLLIRKIYPGW
jgi:hypothetical protein